MKLILTLWLLLVLAAQQKRLQDSLPPAPGSTHHPVASSEAPEQAPYPVTATNPSSSSTTLREDHEFSRARSGSPVNTTILDSRARQTPDNTDTIAASTTAPPAQGTSSDLDQLLLFMVLSY